MASDFFLKWGRAGLSKQQIIYLIHGMCRALHPLAVLHRALLLSGCSTLHTDDLHALCFQMRDGTGSGKGINHLWSLVSGAHEQNQGAVYLA